MENNMINLLINNSKELDNAGGMLTKNTFRKCSALSLTLKGVKADSNRINEAIKVVKSKTSIISNFRGNNLFNTATVISIEEDMNSAFEEINNIYLKLKKVFSSSEYLVLASIVIFNARYRIGIDEAVKNTREIYDNMKKNHRFLTGKEDISAAAMIATTSSNIKETLNQIEEYYEALKNVGLGSKNNLQSISHILPLFKGSVEENVNKVINLEKALKENKVPLKRYSMPLLGVASIVADDANMFAKEVKEVSEIIKKEKGFGSLTLGSTIRNMIAVGIVASSYAEKLGDEEKANLISATNNIALTIQIAIEIAATSAACAAAAASAASSSN